MITFEERMNQKTASTDQLVMFNPIYKAIATSLHQALAMAFPEVPADDFSVEDFYKMTLTCTKSQNGTYCFWLFPLC